jgi:hypothetical protein
MEAIMRIDIQALQAFVDTMVGVPKFSYPARQGGKRPAPEEFAHISLLEEYQISIPAQYIKTQTEEETVYIYQSLAKLRMRIGIVETDGLASVKIMHGWTSEAMKAAMISSGYGFVSCQPISLEDAKLERDWEPRQGFAVELYVTRTYEETVSNIKGVETTGAFTTPEGDTYVSNVEINEP